MATYDEINDGGAALGGHSGEELFNYGSGGAHSTGYAKISVRKNSTYGDPIGDVLAGNDGHRCYVAGRLRRAYWKQFRNAYVAAVTVCNLRLI